MIITRINYNYYLMKKYGYNIPLIICILSLSSVLKKDSFSNLIDKMNLPSSYYYIFIIIFLISFVIMLYLLFSEQVTYEIELKNNKIITKCQTLDLIHYSQYKISGLYNEEFKDLIIWKIIIKQKSKTEKFYTAMSMGQKNELVKILESYNLKNFN